MAKKLFQRRPGLVVMGRDLQSEDCGFEYQHRVLDGNFFTYTWCKNCNVCFFAEKTKINKKEAVVCPLLKKEASRFYQIIIKVWQIGKISPNFVTLLAPLSTEAVQYVAFLFYYYFEIRNNIGNSFLVEGDEDSYRPEW